MSMPHSNGACYEFGPYRLDVGRRILMRGDEAVALAPKVTEILILLVSRAGELIEKADLIEQIWPDSFVEEANVSQNIFYLRRVLGDVRGEPKFIETVVKRGYRFIAPVQVVQCESSESDESETLRSTPPTIAVLPLLNTTKDPEVEYLVDGLTDNIINNLSSVSKVRVMSRSAVGRYKNREVDPQKAGRELGVDALLLGKIDSRPVGLVISVELVDASNGWQLWGESFDCAQRDMLEIQHQILMQLSATLRLKLTGEEEKRITARYTESGEAYQAYLEGRFHWSKYTRTGIEKAIGCFRQAIEVDPNYALAYAGIVDCYLRLATNYLPPEEDSSKQSESAVDSKPVFNDGVTDSRIKLRQEWDWKAAERELRRSAELKSEYPSAHQWYWVYLLSRELFQESSFYQNYAKANSFQNANKIVQVVKRPSQIPRSELTSNEAVQVLCTVAREQIDSGNHEAACALLRDWWALGQWPRVQGLTQQSSADLLFTAGNLAGCVASSRQLPKGQKHGEALLSGSIALYEQLGFPVRASEGRLELALCYFRQGSFDLSRTMFEGALSGLSDADVELRSLALIRLASLERQAGRPDISIGLLTEARDFAERAGPWASARCTLEFASVYKQIAISKNQPSHFDTAKRCYFEALYQFEAVGNHRLTAVVLNNLGVLMLAIGELGEAKSYLLKARVMFAGFDDKIRSAQVDDSLAQLFLAAADLETALEVIERSIQVLEKGDEDAYLAESLVTMGSIYSRLGRQIEARAAFESAHRLALRCGDKEGASRAKLAIENHTLLAGDR